jgi:hypothetical protein
MKSSYPRAAIAQKPEYLQARYMLMHVWQRLLR